MTDDSGTTLRIQIGGIYTHVAQPCLIGFGMPHPYPLDLDLSQFERETSTAPWRTSLTWQNGEIWAQRLGLDGGVGPSRPIGTDARIRGGTLEIRVSALRAPIV